MSFDEVVSAPLDSFHGVPKFTAWSHLFSILNYTPGHHCNSECHGKPKFHIVPCIVVTPNQIHLQIQTNYTADRNQTKVKITKWGTGKYCDSKIVHTECWVKLMTHPTGLAIVQARVGSPRDPLVMRKDTRSLSFKEENALAQSLAVVMTSQSQRKAKKQKQRSHGNESHKFLHINYKHCSVVMMLIGNVEWLVYQLKFLINPPEERKRWDPLRRGGGGSVRDLGGEKELKDLYILWREEIKKSTSASMNQKKGNCQLFFSQLNFSFRGAGWKQLRKENRVMWVFPAVYWEGRCLFNVNVILEKSYWPWRKNVHSLLLDLNNVVRDWELGWELPKQERGEEAAAAKSQKVSVSVLRLWTPACGMTIMPLMKFWLGQVGNVICMWQRSPMRFTGQGSVTAYVAARDWVSLWKLVDRWTWSNNYLFLLCSSFDA